MCIVLLILLLLFHSLFTPTTSARDGEVGEVNVSTLAGLKGTSGSDDGTGTAARFNYPYGIAALPNGDMVVAEYYNHAIRLITAGGVATTLAGSKGTNGVDDGTDTAARFNSPCGIAALLNGNVVVADTYNHAIRLVSAGGVVTTLAGSKGTNGKDDGTGTAARFDHPFGIAALPDGNVVVADYYNHAIRLVTPGGVATTLAGSKGTLGTDDGTGTAARFNSPVGIAALLNGNIVVADTYNHALRLVSPGGVVTTLAGLKGTPGTDDGTGTAARFNRPVGIAALPNGRMVVVDHYTHAIRLVSPGGVVTTLAGLKGTPGTDDGIGTAARFNRPTGIAVLPDGNLVVADYGNHAIRYITINYSSSSLSTSRSRSLSASLTESPSSSSTPSDAASLTESVFMSESVTLPSYSRTESPLHSGTTVPCQSSSPRGTPSYTWPSTPTQVNIMSRKQQQQTQLRLVLGEDAAIAVQTTSVAASVVGSSVLSSGTVARVPMMRSLASSIRCAWAEQELDEHPSYFDLPLQFVSVGDHPKLKHYAGGVVLCGVYVVAWEMTALLCFKTLPGRLHRKVESMLGIGALLWQGYLVPNILQAAVIVWWHGGGGAGLYASAGVVLIVVGYSMTKWLWVLLPAQFAEHAPEFSISRSKDGRTVKIHYFEDEGSAASLAWLRYFGPMFDGAVDPGRTIRRIVVAEEVGTGVLLSILAGIKPEDEKSCRYTAASMLVVTLLHLLYLLAFRPYRTKLDATFANMNGVLMLCQGALAVAITVEGLGDGPLLTCFGVLGLGQLLSLVVQLIVGGLYSHMLKSRRRIIQLGDGVDSFSSSGLSMMVGKDEGRRGEGEGQSTAIALESPLLQAPPTVMELNPLANWRSTP